MLTTSTYVPNQDTHDFRDDVTNELAAGGGYSAGGVTLSGVAVTYDSASNEVRWDFSTDPSFAFSASKTWRNGVVYKSRGGASTADELVAYLVWDSDQTVSTTYTIQLDATGLAKITAA
jgi:hypothetical protein